MLSQNVTLSLPKELLKQAKHLAVERGTSLSHLLAEYMERMVRQDERLGAASRRISHRMKKGYALGTAGRVTHSRESLHER